ncbi:MAG: CDP-archaeol synthase, partial [Rhodothermales bacterium]|nr:CDP-archaeol synthase [Rhodothermales bacterium]
RAGADAVLGSGEAFWLTITVFALVWASDTTAYYVGKAIGRHPLAPSISPKKTWEGSIGGAIGSVVVALILWKMDLVSLRWFDFVVLGLICGSLAQLGDLAESRLKRVAGVKDSGTILPGHGGLLDRLDAMIVAVPLAYMYLAFVAGVV